MMYSTLPAASKPFDLLPFGSVFIEGAKELFGADSLPQMLAEVPVQAGAANSLGFFQADALFSALENQYGLAGGRGLAVRLGRFSFKYFLKEYGAQSGLTAVEFRLLPAPRRIAGGLQLLSDLFAQRLNDRISVKDEGAAWLWRSERCPICVNRKSNDPCCYLMVGMLQEFLSWAGGGRYYRVSEVECRAAGDLWCTYRLEKRPVDGG